MGLMKCMTIDEVIVQLKTLKDYCETSAEECPAKENVWTKDAVALQRAIDILSKLKAQNEGFGIDNAVL